MDDSGGKRHFDFGALRALSLITQAGVSSFANILRTMEQISRSPSPSSKDAAGEKSGEEGEDFHAG